MKKKIFKEFINIALTLAAACISAFTLHYFVYKNGFAPCGVDGIAAMAQEVTGWNAGILTIILNIPLLITAWFFLDKKYVFYTVLHTALTSLFLWLLPLVGCPQYEAHYEKFIAAIFSGLLLGFRSGLMIRLGFSTGGVDIIAAIVQKRRKDINIERIISILCCIIIVFSYLVYKDINCILLSLIQMFVFEKGANILLSDNRDAVVFSIITKVPDAIKGDIIVNLKHGATVVESKGLFTGEDSHLIISLVNRRQIPVFLKLLKKYPDTFVYYTDARGVQGNFRWKRDDEAK